MTQVQEISPNAQQIEYWNATAGDTWAQFQETLDRQIEPLGQAAIDVLDPARGEHIIDIGCGCGQTTLALAARVGPTGSVVGVDISRPMLAVEPASTGSRRERANRRRLDGRRASTTHEYWRTHPQNR